MRTKRRLNSHLNKKGRLKMKLIKEIIIRHQKSEMSIRKISRLLSVPRSTISDYIRRFKSSKLIIDDMQKLEDDILYNRLYPKERKAIEPTKPIPDYVYINKELKRKGVTRMLLWEEYREIYPDGYAYSQYCDLYNHWNKRVPVSMRQIHKAGEKMFVDYSGMTFDIINSQTGEIEKAEIFVACLGASGYSYAEASKNQKKGCFIRSHINAFKFFGGVTSILIPDNLKSAVTKFDWYDPKLNKTYQDMANHYMTTIIPARPYKPKDKAKVELSVKLVQRWILAKLRDRQFFSVAELNHAIRPLLDELNNRKIRHLNKSRYELYEELDKPALHTLPPQSYVYKEFKICRVNIDYHIQLDKCLYSVPYLLAHEEVDVQYSDHIVEVFHKNKRVAVHSRLYRTGAYSTKKEHMASAHKAYAEWTPSRMINWSKNYGKNTQKLIEIILNRKQHPEMSFRTCMGILNTAKKIDNDIVESVSEKMLKLNTYNVYSFRSILKNKTYTKQEPTIAKTPDSNHINVRGRDYYIGGHND